MIKNIHTELIKLAHKKMFWAIHIVLFLIIMYSYYVKAYDVNSGYYQPNIVGSSYMMIFNLCTISLFSFYYSIILFGLISAQDFETNCMSYILLIHKRLYFNIYKVIAGIVIILFNGLIFMLIGFIQGVLFNGNIQLINFSDLFTALICYILICIHYGIISYLLCFIFKNTTFGVVSYIIFSFLKNYLIKESTILLMIKNHSNNLLYYGFNTITNEGDKQIILAVKAPLYNCVLSILFMLLIIFVILTIIEIIASYRDYDA